MERRKFLKTSLIGSISVLCMPLTTSSYPSGKSKATYGLSMESPTRYFDGENCFVHPRAGIEPGAGKNGLPRVVMTMSTQDLSGSDVYRAAYGMETDDLGKTWSTPKELNNLAPRYEVIDSDRRPVALSDFWPHWHKYTKTLLGTGHTVVYTPEWEVTRPRPRHPTYSIYEPDNGKWLPWQKMEMPDQEKFHDCGVGSVQRYDKSDGTILLPVAFHPHPLGKNGSVTVTRCSLYNKILRYLEHGDEISIDDDTRGLYEPSLTYFNGEYFLTIRHDKLGYVARSQDGLHFSPIKPWTFDNGEELGNYNTQQHWVTHSDGLFLVYTRRGADNDHVFRHRTPLFIGRIDPDRLCVIRETEKILVPERGARLGNFGITDVSRDETWVTVSEWMQPHPQKINKQYGADGSVFVARIHWDKPNRLFTV